MTPFGLRKHSYLMVPGWYVGRDHKPLVTFAAESGLRLLPTHEWWDKGGGQYRPTPALRALLRDCRDADVSIGMHTLIAVGFPGAATGPQWPIGMLRDQRLRDLSASMSGCRMLTPTGWRYQAESAAAAAAEHGINWVYSDGLEEAHEVDGQLYEATRDLLAIQRDTLALAGVELAHELIGSDPEHVPSACDLYESETLEQSLFTGRRRGALHSVLRCLATGKGASGTRPGRYGCVGWIPLGAAHGVLTGHHLELVLDLARVARVPVALQLHPRWTTWISDAIAFKRPDATRAVLARAIREFVEGG